MHLVFALLIALVTEESSAKIVSESLFIRKKPIEVWARIGSFGDLSWTSQAIQVQSSSQNRDGDIRIVNAPQGFRLKEILIRYDSQNMSYTYRIEVMSSANQRNDQDAGVDAGGTHSPMIGSLSVRSTQGGSRVEWQFDGVLEAGKQFESDRFASKVMNGPSEPRGVGSLNSSAGIESFISSFYHQSLDSLKKKLENPNHKKK